MKKIKHTNLILLCVAVFAFYACNQDDVKKTSESQKQTDKKLYKIDPQGNYYLGYEDVEADLLALGATEVAAPPNFVNPFEGTTAVHHFVRNDKTYTVFVFPYGEIDEDAGTVCTRNWNSEGEGKCENSGNNCDFEINADTTGFKIICCD